MKNIQRSRNSKKRADVLVPAATVVPVRLPSVDAPPVHDVILAHTTRVSSQSSCADPPVTVSAGRRTRPRPIRSVAAAAALPPSAISNDVAVSSQRTAQAPEQERAPKVQKTIATYQSVIVDAITTMKELLDKGICCYLIAVPIGCTSCAAGVRSVTFAHAHDCDVFNMIDVILIHK